MATVAQLSRKALRSTPALSPSSHLYRSFSAATVAGSQPSAVPPKRQIVESHLGFVSSWKTNLGIGNLANSHVINSRRLIHDHASNTYKKEGGISRSMEFVKETLINQDMRDNFRSARQNTEEEKLDVVHIKLIKNNTFVTITDSKGNKKMGVSSGCLEEMKGGPKLSRYAAEATAEHVGRVARNMGLKSVVMRVNGFTHFKKKKQAILSWRDGYTFGKGDQNPIAYIEDTTRRAHNGCRLPKQRRV